MEPFAYVVGVQLGRAHRISLREVAPTALLRHLHDNIDELVSVAAKMNDELMRTWRSVRATHGDASVDGRR
jgi:hypothetical protein